MEQDRKNLRNMRFEYVLPSSWWKETADSHCLLIDVPGFKKEEVRIRADSNDHVIVSGERQPNDNTILHFEQAYKVPDDCNIQETTAILEDDTYYVIIPKKLPSQNHNSIPSSLHTQDTPSHEEKKGNEEWKDITLLKKLSKILKNKRCMVLSALLAISFGVLVSYRYQSVPEQSKWWSGKGLISYQKETKKRAEDDT